MVNLELLLFAADRASRMDLQPLFPQFGPFRTASDPRLPRTEKNHDLNILRRLFSSWMKARSRKRSLRMKGIAMLKPKPNGARTMKRRPETMARVNRVIVLFLPTKPNLRIRNRIMTEKALSSMSRPITRPVRSTIIIDQLLKTGQHQGEG